MRTLLSVKGDYNSIINKLSSLSSTDSKIRPLLVQCGEEGVAALQAATPVRSGMAASSWTYEIGDVNGAPTVEWHNYDVEGGCNVVVLLRYGHATRGGTYVSGYDFVTPAIDPVISKYLELISKEVSA